MTFEKGTLSFVLVNKASKTMLLFLVMVGMLVSRVTEIWDKALFVADSITEDILSR